MAIAAYVTTGARLKLYSYLDTSGESVLYCDTNSVIHIRNVADPPNVPTGDFLGKLTNELEDFGPDAYIDKFVSSGPQNNAFSVQ